MIRRATADDAGDVARLLHDFNSEYEEHTPGVEALTDHAREPARRGRDHRPLRRRGPRRLLPAALPPLDLQRQARRLHPGALRRPGRRGEGLGRALLEAALDAAREAGAAHVELTTGEDDTEARRLYESAGFTNREGRPDGPRMLYYERDL